MYNIDFLSIFCRQDVVMPCPIQCSDVVSNNLIEDVSMLNMLNENLSMHDKEIFLAFDAKIKEVCVDFNVSHDIVLSKTVSAEGSFLLLELAEMKNSS